MVPGVDAPKPTPPSFSPLQPHPFSFLTPTTPFNFSTPITLLSFSTPTTPPLLLPHPNHPPLLPHPNHPSSTPPPQLLLFFLYFNSFFSFISTTPPLPFSPPFSHLNPPPSFPPQPFILPLFKPSLLFQS